MLPARRRPPVDGACAALLDALRAGRTTDEALISTGLGVGDGLAALSALELDGYLRREPGGRFTALP